MSVVAAYRTFVCALILVQGGMRTASGPHTSEDLNLQHHRCWYLNLELPCKLREGKEMHCVSRLDRGRSPSHKEGRLPRLAWK
jgi:hypothetical protein